MNRNLHLRIQILHTERRTRTPEAAKRGNDFRRCCTRVYLHGNFRVRRKAERSVQHFRKPINLPGRKRARRSAAEMKLPHDKLLQPECRFFLYNFFLQRIEITVSGGLTLACRDIGTAAIPTQFFAKRNVDIERNFVPAGSDIFPHYAKNTVNGNIVAKLQRRRVRRIARSRHVILFDQIKVYVHWGRI